MILTNVNPKKNYIYKKSNIIFLLNKLFLHNKIKCCKSLLNKHCVNLMGYYLRISYYYEFVTNINYIISIQTITNVVFYQK